MAGSLKPLTPLILCFITGIHVWASAYQDSPNLTKQVSDGMLSLLQEWLPETLHH